MYGITNVWENRCVGEQMSRKTNVEENKTENRGAEAKQMLLWRRGGR